jgi:disulfide bond formation protein DsbB
MYAAVVQALGLLTLLAMVSSVLLLGTLAPGRGRIVAVEDSDGARRLLLAGAWVVAIVATSGSLYFSAGVGFVPCVLCWYQRIAMYPLVLILGVATLTGDAKAWRYVVPLAGAGLLVAAYHVMIQLRPEAVASPCTLEAPCSARHLSLYGFISIPVMAGTAFLLIGLLVLSVRNRAPSD